MSIQEDRWIEDYIISHFPKRERTAVLERFRQVTEMYNQDEDIIHMLTLAAERDRFQHISRRLIKYHNPGEGEGKRVFQDMYSELVG